MVVPGLHSEFKDFMLCVSSFTHAATSGLCERCNSWRNMNWQKMDGVLIVGGGAQIPSEQCLGTFEQGRKCWCKALQGVNDSFRWTLPSPVWSWDGLQHPSRHPERDKAVNKRKRSNFLNFNNRYGRYSPLHKQLCPCRTEAQGRCWRETSWKDGTGVWISGLFFRKYPQCLFLSSMEGSASIQIQLLRAQCHS